ncbi:MAG: glycerophosphodiester phosphodiesterase family protein [Candidatus Omnitrophota bacterium]
MTLRIGHRGARGYAPENTLASFRKALELNVDMVELDVYACRTGQIVAIHDAKIDRTTSIKGFVCEKTFDELRELDVGNGQRIPTLEEVLQLVNKQVSVNVELKGENAAKSVADIINKYVNIYDWNYDDFLVSSFNHYELLEFNKACPNVRIGAVIAGIPIGYAECAQKVKAFSLHPSKEFINQALIDDAHQRGMKVFVYTVNEPDDIQRMKNMGVDGIFSDFPDRI